MMAFCSKTSIQRLMETIRTIIISYLVRTVSRGVSLDSSQAIFGSQNNLISLSNLYIRTSKLDTTWMLKIQNEIARSNMLKRSRCTNHNPLKQCHPFYEPREINRKIHYMIE
jgi:hypothetical protein